MLLSTEEGFLDTVTVSWLESPLPDVGDTVAHPPELEVQAPSHLIEILALVDPSPAKVTDVGETDIGLSTSTTPDCFHVTILEALPHVNVKVPVLEELVMLTPGLKRTWVNPLLPEEGSIVPIPVSLTAVQAPDDCTLKLVSPSCARKNLGNSSDDGVTIILLASS